MDARNERKVLFPLQFVRHTLELRGKRVDNNINAVTAHSLFRLHAQATLGVNG